MESAERGAPSFKRHHVLMQKATITAAERIAGLIGACPTPYHAVEKAVELIAAAGGRIPSTAREAVSPGLWYRAEGGTLSAWCVGEHHSARNGLRLVGAHTDSPNLRLKPQPDRDVLGYRQLGMHVYGGLMLHAWLDRDLGVAGRLAVRDSRGSVSNHLVCIDEPLLYIPQLAPHLDREVNDKGLLLNPQKHMSPIWGLRPLNPAASAPGQQKPSSPIDEGDTFMSLIAERAGVEADDIIGHDLMAFDIAPARLVGDGRSMLASARLDDLLSCFLAIQALLAVHEGAAGLGNRIPTVCLFDHEEVGSLSSSGAASPRLANFMAMLAAGFDASIDDIAAARSDSLLLSADGAHATHPNYTERHDPEHVVVLNGGPVLKVNPNQNYTTDALTGAAFQLACEKAGAPIQHFVSRADLACGSTIGPVLAGRMGINAVDAGCAQLAMHSTRELCGVQDMVWFQAALEQFMLG